MWQQHLLSTSILGISLFSLAVLMQQNVQFQPVTRHVHYQQTVCVLFFNKVLKTENVTIGCEVDF